MGTTGEPERVGRVSPQQQGVWEWREALPQQGVGLHRLCLGLTAAPTPLGLPMFGAQPLGATSPEAASLSPRSDLRQGHEARGQLC